MKKDIEDHSLEQYVVSYDKGLLLRGSWRPGNQLWMNDEKFSALENLIRAKLHLSVTVSFQVLITYAFLQLLLAKV